MGKRVATAAAKAARQTQRRHLGSLQTLVLKPSTLKRYNTAVTAFLLWVSINGISLPKRKPGIDLLLASYVEHLWEEGDPRSRAGDTISGLQHRIPSLKRSLFSSWRLFGAWQRAELPERAPPLTAELVICLVGYFLCHNLDDMAVICWLEFHCILRTGEGLALKASDIYVDKKCRNGVVRLDNTKSGSRTGTKESVTITDTHLLRLLAAYLSKLDKSELLLQRHSVAFRKLYAKAFKDLGLADWGFKPYSLRRGGATHFFRETGVLSQVTVRGRWLHAKTARLYINEALAVLASIQNDIDNSHCISYYSAAATSFLHDGKKKKPLKA